jgi:drug/metabolite transporter (DMT)-like permease
MSLTYFGAMFIPSGLISILFALTPVVSSLMAALVFGRGDFSRLGWLAFAVAFSGVVVICLDGLVLREDGWIGVLMLLAAVVLYAASGILVQREAYQAHPLAITVGALVLSLPLYLLLWWSSDGQLPHIDWHSRSPWAVLYLAVFGSLIGFMSYYYIIRVRGATVVSMTTLVTPVFALYLGHQLNGEQISSQLMVGSALVLSGLSVYFVALAPGRVGAQVPVAGCEEGGRGV